MTGSSARQAGKARPQPDAIGSARRGSVDFPVVGLGASAGGLDAAKKLLDAMPASCGMAFVLIQHLDPKHQSMMADLLAGHTPMRVLQATDGMLLGRDHVYLIPPGTYLAIDGDKLRLSKPTDRHGARMPYDFFLRSLAQACGERAICVILSGTGTDGSLGLKAVKEQGGLVIVQDPGEAAFQGEDRRSGDRAQRGMVDRLQGLVPHARRNTLRSADDHGCGEPLPDRGADRGADVCRRDGRHGAGFR